ncbi:competence protein ComEC [Nitrosospira sp. Nl5]|uniref:ComEC/Rec2 family competence protein n=1 Tax=Nitrosospira sp. Nl5 TaxID=200120 RepID=UPI00088A129E|nr:ComEC/Rec2 family competence protein [Nitrosospira sp. Nl5]SCY17892.1 competence protein ComEC [Nitrosospira sp. Nl5]
MRTCILAFALGVGLLQQQAELPEIAWAWMLVPVAVPAFLLWRCQAAIFAVPGKILVVAIFVAIGFFWAAAFAQWRMADVLPHAWEGRDIQLIGVVAELPQANEHNVRFAFDVEQVLTHGAIVPARISLAWYKERGKHAETSSSALPRISAGERWRITARLKRPHGSVNPHGFDFEEWALERNIRATGYVRKADDNLRLNEMVNLPAYRVERLRQEIRDRFIQALPDHAYAGVLVALAVGDQRAIPAGQWQIFTRTGVNHLMSISGLHVTMVSGLIFALVYWLWRRSYRLALWLPARKAAVIAGLAAALGYALLAGFAVPAQRTVYMLAAVAIALWLGRFTSAMSVLSWALLTVIVLDPWAILSPGFWLSFGAIAVIMLVSAGRIGKMHWFNGWARIQWAITLGLVPPLLVMFQQVSLVSPIANAIAIPLVSLVVVPLTLLATLPPLDFLLLPAHAVLSGCMDVMRWMSEVPQAVWSQHAPPAWTVAAAMAGIVWMLLPGGSGWGQGLGFTAGFPARWLGAVALLPIFLVLPPKPASGELWLTVLDVGQGLAIVARTENHALLYDTGPGFGSETDSGNRIIVPFLRGEGVKQLDAMIVTHADLDHSGGALSVLEAVPVERLVSSLHVDHPIQLAAANRQRCSAGESWQWDGVRFDMLHPSEQSYSNPKLKTNALSCVLKITTAHGSVLLPGDIEKKSESQLLAYDSDMLSSMVLVAPHHGSKTSSTDAFVRQVNPRLVIFTVGYRNRFGHPRSEVVNRYRALGSNVLRSDSNGAILLRFADNSLAVETARALRRRYWQDIPDIDESR